MFHCFKTNLKLFIIKFLSFLGTVIRHRSHCWLSRLELLIFLQKITEYPFVGVNFILTMNYVLKYGLYFKSYCHTIAYRPIRNAGSYWISSVLSLLRIHYRPTLKGGSRLLSNHPLQGGECIRIYTHYSCAFSFIYSLLN